MSPIQPKTLFRAEIAYVYLVDNLPQKDLLKCLYQFFSGQNILVFRAFPPTDFDPLLPAPHLPPPKVRKKR